MQSLKLEMPHHWLGGSFLENKAESGNTKYICKPVLLSMDHTCSIKAEELHLFVGTRGTDVELLFKVILTLCLFPFSSMKWNRTEFTT